MSKILVIQLARMGDLLQSSPLIQAIRAKRPAASITLLVSERNREVARTIPGVNEVLGLDFGKAYGILNDGPEEVSLKYHRFRALVDGLRGRCFEEVYNLNHSDINANLMNLIRYQNAFCYGLDGRGRRILKDQWLSYMFTILEDRKLNRFNLVDIYLHGSHLGAGSPVPVLRPDGEMIDRANRYLVQQGVLEGEPLIGFQLGAGDGIRRWPVTSYAYLADLLLRRHDVKILLFGSPSERESSSEFQARFDENHGVRDRVIDLVGQTTYQDLAAFLGKCDLLVTPDTGTMHVAAAVGTRVLALFMGSAFCHETGPYGPDHFVLHPNLGCYPCLQDRPSCMDYPCKRLISPEAVAQVIGWICQGKNGRPTEADIGFSDNRLRLLRSQMNRGFVECVPVKGGPFSLEDLMAQGYRMMWQGVLDDRWNGIKTRLKEVLDTRGRVSLPREEIREIAGLEEDFGRLESAFDAASGSSHAADRLTRNIAHEEADAIRWVRPIIRFFKIEQANICLSGQRVDGQLQRLLRRLARGAGFMKAFCQTLSNNS